MSNSKPQFYKIYNMSINEISQRFEFLGEGISRTVFAINDDYVIKVAKGSEGLYQNKVEKYVFSHCGKNLRKYLCPIIWFKPDMIVMPRAVPLSLFTKQKYLDIKKIRTEPEAYEELLYLTKRFYLFYEDIVSVSSWGVINKQPVLIDYGCTSEKGDRYYDLK